MTDEVKNDAQPTEDELVTGGEVAQISATGTVTVTWSAEKEANDTWRAFDKITPIVFEAWGINRKEAENVVKERSEEYYKASKVRWYNKKPGSITFHDGGYFT